MAKTSSTRIWRRTFHSQIATHDEFDRKNAIDRVFFSFIKPGEDLVWMSRSVEDLFQVTIERGNPCNRHTQIIHERIMVDPGLLKRWKSGAAEHDRSGETWGNFQLTLIVRNLFSSKNGSSAMYEEVIHDRSGKLEENSWDTLQEVDPHREEHLLGRNAYSARYGETSVSASPRTGLFRHGEWRSRICEQSQRPSAKRRTLQSQVTNIQ